MGQAPRQRRAHSPPLGRTLRAQRGQGPPKASHPGPVSHHLPRGQPRPPRCSSQTPLLFSPHFQPQRLPRPLLQNLLSSHSSALTGPAPSRVPWAALPRPLRSRAIAVRSPFLPQWPEGAREHLSRAHSSAQNPLGLPPRWEQKPMSFPGARKALHALSHPRPHLLPLSLLTQPPFPGGEHQAWSHLRTFARVVPSSPDTCTASTWPRGLCFTAACSGRPRWPQCSNLLFRLFSPQHPSPACQPRI